MEEEGNDEEVGESDEEVEESNEELEASDEEVGESDDEVKESDKAPGSLTKDVEIKDLYGVPEMCDERCKDLYCSSCYRNGERLFCIRHNGPSSRIFGQLKL